MKKILLVISILLVLVGCQTDGTDLPPEPGSPGAPIGEAAGIYDGYGPPYDVFDDNKQIFFLSKNVFNLPPEQESFYLNAKVEHENAYVYKYGYFYTNGGWKKFQFYEKTVSGSNWISQKGNVGLRIKTQELTPGENYIVAYSCKKYDGQWKCGCSGKYGPCNQWMLQTYLYRNVELPPEPIPPGSLITTRAYISPHGILAREGKKVDLYISLESTQDILENLEKITLSVTKPDDNKDFVELTKTYGVNCRECNEDWCGSKFICYSHFSGSYEPSLMGEHIIDLETNIAKPENIDVQKGNFKLVEDEFFKENIIEEDIGKFDFRRSSGWYSTNGYGLYAIYQTANTHAFVEVLNDNWIYKTFENIKNNKNYKAIEIDGNVVYVREIGVVEEEEEETEEEVEEESEEEVVEAEEAGGSGGGGGGGSAIIVEYKSIDYAWLSSGKLIRIYISGRNISGHEVIVKAYLEKHPVQEQTCTDSDGGKEYYTKGDCAFSKCEQSDQGGGCGGGGTFDACLDSDTLRECYCDNLEIKTVEYECPDDCKDGACIEVVHVEEGWVVGTASDKLEMSESLKVGLTNMESIADITQQSFIDDTEMPNLLSAGIASNSKGDAPYNQRLFFEDISTGYVQFLEDRDDVAADFLYFPNGKQIARYELEFTTSLESDVDDSNGAKTTTGDYLTDFEDVELTMLGNTYTIVQAKRNGGQNSQIELTLMSGAIRDDMLEGDTKTYTVNGKDYEVSLVVVDYTGVKFSVNGEKTSYMQEGDIYKLSDGTQIGVSKIIFQDYAGGVHMAEFFLGMEKLELRDTNIKDIASTNELKVNGELIDGAKVWVEGSDDDTTYKIDKIVVNMIADDDYYVGAGDVLSENQELDEPALLFTQGWDIEYRGLSEESFNQINIKASGTDDYNLEFNDGNENKVTMPFMYSTFNMSVRLGDNNDDLIINENSVITKDDYLIVTDYSEANGRRKSFALRYRGADKITADNPVIKFDDLGSGDRIERAISDSDVIATIKLGGANFNVYNGGSMNSSDFDIKVDLNADGSLGNDRVSINTQFGANIEILNVSEKDVYLLISTPNTDDYDDLIPREFMFRLYADSSKVRLENAMSQSHNFLTPDNDEGNMYAYSSYGAFARISIPINDPQELFIEYPENQRTPEVSVVSVK